jgi:hypothetical protein
MMIMITMFLAFIGILVNGAYNDYRSQYTRVDSAMPWDNAQAYCKSRGVELAPMTNAVEVALINALRSPHASTYVGVRCRAYGVAHDWSYLGSTYIQSTGAARNPNWCGGEPNGNCSAEDCMHVYSSGCWNDIRCTSAYPFICGLPVCKRE